MARDVSSSINWSVDLIDPRTLRMATLMTDLLVESVPALSIRLPGCQVGKPEVSGVRGS